MKIGEHRLEIEIKDRAENITKRIFNLLSTKAMKVKPTIIGICGGSCSGKTYFTEKIEHHFLPSKVSTISQDNYYKDLSRLSIETREK